MLIISEFHLKPLTAFKIKNNDDVCLWKHKKIQIKCITMHIFIHDDRD